MHQRFNFGDVHGERLKRRHIKLVVKVPNVGQNREVLHARVVLRTDHVDVTCGGDHKIELLDDRLKARNLVAIHRRLQGANRIDLTNDYAGALTSQCLGATLAHVAIASNKSGLAANQNVGSAVEAVEQRVANAIFIVKLALGDGIVHVDHREQQFAFALKNFKPLNARGGLFAASNDGCDQILKARRVQFFRVDQKLMNNLVLPVGPRF